MHQNDLSGPYLIIDEFQELSVKTEYDSEWENAVMDGIMYVICWYEGSYWELQGDGSWHQLTP